jgi:hypothetical protein
VSGIPEVYDITTDRRRPATQDDINRLERLAAIHGMTRRILRRMVDFPQAVPASDEALKFQHELLRKMCDLIDHGHIEG